MWDNTREEVDVMGGDTFDIDKMLNFCTDAKINGATEIYIEAISDRGMISTFIRAFKVLTPEEIKQKKIEALKRQLKMLEEEECVKKQETLF